MIERQKRRDSEKETEKGRDWLKMEEAMNGRLVVLGVFMPDSRNELDSISKRINLTSK